MLSAEGVSYSYDRRSAPVLRDVSIDVASRAVTGLQGPSGSGKSTLGALLGGLRTPSAGRVVVDGAPLLTGRGAPAGPRPVQVVLQQPERAMNPRWSIRAVLAEAFEGRRPEALERATAWVEADAESSTALVRPGWLDRFPHEISGGELQRVNLARALMTQPRYLVADEISASLDAVTQALLWHRIADEVRDTGLGVLAISHDAELLQVVADPVLTFSGAGTS